MQIPPTCRPPVNRQTGVKTLPFPKPRLWVVINNLTIFLQIEKINLRREDTFQISGLLTTDISEENQLLARVALDGRFHIRMLNRLSGEVCNTIASECDHTPACLIAHPTKAGFVFEGCSECQVIRSYEIQTAECKLVHTGSRPTRMCHGPNSSILVQCRDFPAFESSHTGLSEFKWEDEQQELRSDKSVYRKGRLIQMCYTEKFDILVVMCENRKVEAVKLGNNSPVWKLPGVVDGHMIKPDAINSDKKGNVYIGDGLNNRILKISSLTGNVLNIFLLEEEEEEEEQQQQQQQQEEEEEEENQNGLRSLFLTDTEPNLTVVRGDRLRTYNIPKLD